MTPLEEHITAALGRFDERFRMEEAALEGRGVGHSLGAEVRAFIKTELRAMRDAVIEECERCVPEERSQSQFLRQITHADIPLANIQARAMELGWGGCRSATLTALSALKGELLANKP